MNYERTNYSKAFVHEVLPRIAGKPTYAHLKILKDLLIENSSTVDEGTELGGGNHGHLGLVLDDATYFEATGEHYMRPPFPGLLIIPAGTALHEAHRLTNEHIEAKALYRTTIDIENALKKQIIQCIEDQYIKELRDRTSRKVTADIPAILTFLFTRYGLVNQETLNFEEDKIKSYSWNVADPPTVFFTQIEDLQALAAASATPKTIPQLIQLGINIIQATGEFQSDLKDWYRRAETDKTWDNFKTDFTTAHAALMTVRNPNTENSSFHHANAITDLGREVARLRTDVQDSVNVLTSLMAPPTHTPASAPQQNESANGISSPYELNQILAALQSITNRITTLETTGTNNSNTSQRPGVPRRRRNVSNYCWSHGACAHTSAECQNKRTGHQDAATFNNKMGGSTSYCTPQGA